MHFRISKWKRYCSPGSSARDGMREAGASIEGRNSPSGSAGSRVFGVRYASPESSSAIRVSSGNAAIDLQQERLDGEQGFVSGGAAWCARCRRGASYGAGRPGPGGGSRRTQRSGAMTSKIHGASPRDKGVTTYTFVVTVR